MNGPTRGQPNWGRWSDSYWFTHLGTSECTAKAYPSGTIELQWWRVPILLTVRGPAVRRLWASLHYWWVEDWQMSVIRRVVASSGGAAKGTSGEKPEEHVLYPGIIEMMTVDKYADGEVRHLSALLLLVEGASWKGCLTDKDNGRNLWRSAATVDGLLQEIEEALQSGQEGHWRRSQGDGGKARKRR